MVRQSGSGETGLPDIQVTLQADLNGDGTYVTIATVDSDASGNYSFGSLPDGDYRIVVDDSDADLPNDSFGNPYEPTTNSSVGCHDHRRCGW